MAYPTGTSRTRPPAVAGSTLPGPALSRRTLLAGGLAGMGALVLAGCGDDPDVSVSGAGSGTETGAGAGPGSLTLGASFPQNGYLVTGSPQRMAVVLADGDGPVAQFDQPLSFSLYEPGQGGSGRGALLADGIVVPPHADGVPRAYFPVTATFATPGIYELVADLDGTEASLSVQVSDPAGSLLPQVGSPLPPQPTPTAADPHGVSPLCTATPECPLHAVSLDAVLANGRPTALLVASPAFCQTAVCGPVLDILLEGLHDRAIDAVHCEVYANPEAVDNVLDADQAPIVAAYGMVIEPSLFLADAAGVVVARLDGVFDRTELAEALTAAGA